jgi:hypothetical protein
MLRALRAVRLDKLVEGAPPPRTLNIYMNEHIAAFCPTHMLAVYPPPMNQPKSISLTPVHAIVLQAYCSNTFNLPISRPDVNKDVSSNGTIALPVVPFCVPSVDAFHRIQRYLYVPNVESLFAWLLPMPIKRNIPLFELISRLSQSNLDALMKSVALTKSLYLTACALHVVDDSLWRIIEFSWAGLIRAIGELSVRDNVTDVAEMQTS